MDLKAKFPSGVSGWVKYNRYHYDKDRGQSVVCPLPDSQPILYNPLDAALDMLLDALNLGREIKQETIDEKQGLLDFIQKYGLIGVCADLPLNENFFQADMRVHIPDNPLGFPTGTIELGKYLDHFFPNAWLPNSDEKLGDLARRQGDLYNSLFSKEYGEEVKWLKRYCLSLWRLALRLCPLHFPPLPPFPRLCGLGKDDP